MHPSHFIHCSSCGFEFQSVFAGAVLVRNSAQGCPSCGTVIQTPFIAGGENFDLINQRIKEPMIKDYGDDGYVFMGMGQLFFTIKSPAIKNIHAVYDRNVHRALDLIDLIDTSTPAYTQTLLGSAVLATMTAYECLIDGLLKALRELKDPSASKLKPRPSLADRRTAVLDALKHNHKDAHVIALQYLYEFRNCLTHKAGIVDEALIAKIDRIGRTSYAFSAGTPLPLHRSWAISFLDSLQQLATVLLEKADGLAQSSGRTHRN